MASVPQSYATSSSKNRRQNDDSLPKAYARHRSRSRSRESDRDSGAQSANNRCNNLQRQNFNDRRPSSGFNDQQKSNNRDPRLADRRDGGPPAMRANFNDNRDPRLANRQDAEPPMMDNNRDPRLANRRDGGPPTMGNRDPRLEHRRDNFNDDRDPRSSNGPPTGRDNFNNQNNRRFGDDRGQGQRSSFQYSSGPSCDDSKDFNRFNNNRDQRFRDNRGGNRDFGNNNRGGGRDFNDDNRGGNRNFNDNRYNNRDFDNNNRFKSDGTLESVNKLPGFVPGLFSCFDMNAFKKMEKKEIKREIKKSVDDDQEPKKIADGQKEPKKEIFDPENSVVVDREPKKPFFDPRNTVTSDRIPKKPVSDPKSSVAVDREPKKSKFDPRKAGEKMPNFSRDEKTDQNDDEDFTKSLGDFMKIKKSEPTPQPPPPSADSMKKFKIPKKSKINNDENRAVIGGGGIPAHTFLPQDVQNAAIPSDNQVLVEKRIPDARPNFIVKTETMEDGEISD